jgi:hypothetical protein
MDFPFISFHLTLAWCFSIAKSWFDLDWKYFLAASVKVVSKGDATSLKVCYFLSFSFPKIDVNPSEWNFGAKLACLVAVGPDSRILNYYFGQAKPTSFEGLFPYSNVAASWNFVQGCVNEHLFN